MLTVLKSLIVSNVEYACIIWSPTDSCHIKLIEGVQRKFTSRFACFQTYDENLGMSVCTTQYHDRLKILKIYSLERRRERYMIIYMYKIVTGMVPNPGLTITYDPRRKLFVAPKMASRTATAWVKKVRRSSFMFQGPVLYNKLPAVFREITQEPDVNSFKRKLDLHLATIPDLPGTQMNSLAAL